MNHINPPKTDLEGQNRFRALLENTPEAVIELDPSGVILYLNRPLPGVPEEETLGRSICDFLPDSRKTEILDCLRRVLETGRYADYRLPIRFPEGERWWTGRIIPEIRDGRIIALLMTGADATREVDLETRLLHSQKMEALGTLAGGIAHDFNNILNIILGYTELAAEDLPADHPVHDHLHEISTAGQRASRLVKQILTFCRRDDETLRPVRLQPVIQEALEMIRATIPRTIEIEEDIDPRCGSVLADPTSIHQVMMNLCANAWHAMRAGGGTLSVSLDEVRLSASEAAYYINLEPGPHARIIVTDTGQGMDEEILKRIFDPYFTTKEPGEGTGLGLATVHGIVISHGGAITVESAPGMGSAFTILLPLCAAHPEETAAIFSPDGVSRGAERIMFVDDEESICELTRLALGSLGFQVDVFRDGESALEAFLDAPGEWDIVVTDHSMPRLAGYDLAREMLQVRAGLPIILLTGYSEMVRESDALSMGIREYLIKPVIPSELARIIRRILDEGRPE